MLSELQINTIVTELQAVVKAYYGSINFDDKKKKGELPNYSPIYAETVTLQQEVAVHSEIKDFPEKLFKTKAPNESDEQWNYRKANYEPVTMPFWNRAVGVFNRVWNENNYEIKWTENDQQKEYFTKGYPEYGKITSYLESIVTRYKVNDPNAVLVIKPWYLPTVPDGENIKLDDSVEMPAVAYIYCADKVCRFERDFALFLTDENSNVTVGERVENTGLVYELYDDQNIYKVTQTGKKNDWTFEVQVFYTHGIGYLPCQRLKGLPIYKDGHLYYKSILYDATPLLNDALYDYSTNSISKVGAAFPIRWAITETCTYQGEHGEPCQNGRIFTGDADGNVKSQVCPGCKGSGRTNPFTPMGIMEVRMPTEKFDNPVPIPTPPGGFLGPDVKLLEFMGETVFNYIQQAFLLLNISVTPDRATGKVDTATGKQIDREELFSAIQTFSSEIFDLLGFTIDAIGKMRYGINWKGPEISKPVNFAIRSESDLTTEIAEAKTNNLPEAALRRLIKEYMNIRFTDSTADQAITDLIMQVDPIFTYAVPDIISGMGAGYIQKWEAELHKNINQYIALELAGDKTFLTWDLEKQREALITRAKAAVDANKPMTPDNILGAAKAMA